jgi:molybdopterin-synthase adenylyltransferase
MSLPPDRLERFARHIVLPELGGAGQVALGQARVTVIGLGGIGAPVVQYLAAAGVGHLRLLDCDSVELSNLQRQVIYQAHDVGQPKNEMAAGWVEGFDSAIQVEDGKVRIDPSNADSYIAKTDLVVDGTDNFAARLAISDACVRQGIPLTSAALGRFQGQVANFAGHLEGHSCYRCFVGDAFDADDCDTCAADGVLGAMVGMVGAFAAMQAIRVLLEGKTALGDPQWGQLHLFEGLVPSLRTMRIARDPECRGCSKG